MGFLTGQSLYRRRKERHGFIRADLCAAISVLCLLLLVCLPALGKARESKGVLCLSNVAAITRACILFAEDHSAALPRNPQGQQASLAGETDWATGWLDFTSSTANTDPAALRALSFAAYLPNVSTYHCPADLSISAAQRLRGASHRVRSYSMNGFVGVSPASGLFAGYLQYARLNDFIKPPPAEIFLVLDENSDSINDPVFFIDPNPATSSLLDYPAFYHDGAGAVSFADGHAELKVWEPSTRVSGSVLFGGSRLDAQWLGRRATSRP